MSQLTKNMKSVNAKLEELDAKIERISQSLERQPVLNTGRYDKRQTWKNTVYEKVDTVIDRSHRNGRLVVLQDIYASMEAKQGISWDHEVARYADTHHVTKPTILDVIYDSPSFRSAFDETLNGMMEINLTVDEIIEPLTQKYHDHSTSNMVTWKRVYRAMDQKRHINWLMYAVKLMDVEYSRPVTKKELIAANKELKEEFFYTVKELMAA